MGLFTLGLNVAPHKRAVGLPEVSHKVKVVACSAAVNVAALFRCSDSLSVLCFSAAMTLMVAWLSISCHALSNSHSFELDKNLCSARAIVSFAAAWMPEVEMNHANHR